ncbi:MAG: SMC-Scp complex subunit ScpB [Parcubacteria group bacterium]
MTLDSQIEAILFFKNEPVTVKDLSMWLQVTPEEINDAIARLEEGFNNRGITILVLDDKVALGTNPELSSLIEKLQKEELSCDIGRAGIEALSIILYKGPIPRREIDYIRGVNSGFILRNLLIRGLIERENVMGERSYVYRPTLELFKYLGITRKEELPQFEKAFGKIAEFVENGEHGTE